MDILKIFGLKNKNKKAIERYSKIVSKINEISPSIEPLSDSELKLKTEYFRNILQDDKSKIDLLLPEAFAVVREASKRVLNMRHFDVQLIGGIALHEGKIAEMRTGEGKTLVATLPAYLNALSGEPVHIVTANDYLVERDAKWMGKIFEFLGMSVGYVIGKTPNNKRKLEYDKDITYVANNELGFDYLRDNMKHDISDITLFQRGFKYAIIDEIDSILIDEARTPLIISGPTQTPVALYSLANKIVSKLTENDHYTVDEKTKQVHLTNLGFEKVEELAKEEKLILQNEHIYGLSHQANFEEYDPNFYIKTSTIINCIDQALKANYLFKCDVDYIVKDKKVLIVDDFTGRVMDGRRYSDGLHQALEAKHGVTIQQETQTLASTSYQNYFRMYEKICGMTGTAKTEEDEFFDIYGLDVIEIPTNKPIKRDDKNDLVYKTEKEKFEAVAKLVKERSSIGQPILVGTASIEKSEAISKAFSKLDIKHSVLNAKQHEMEASIIAQAGRFGAVTIATNMAGRGTDIVLGGNIEKQIDDLKAKGENDQSIEQIRQKWQEECEKVKAAGGLLVVGSERHESRRIDNQLRGRSGRQGDVGSTIFYLSLEDSLLRIFGGDKIKFLLSKVGLKEGESMDHPLLNGVIEKAQKKIENYNYEIRKNLIKYDDVMNEQRSIVYKKRFDILSCDLSSLLNMYKDMLTEEISLIAKSSFSKNEISDDKYELFIKRLSNTIQLNFDDINEILYDKNNEKSGALTEAKFVEACTLKAVKIFENFMTKEQNTDIIRSCLLFSIDESWRGHLHIMDHIRSGINLRSYAQKDPLSEYKIEAFENFSIMLARFSELAIQQIIPYINIKDEEAI